MLIGNVQCETYTRLAKEGIAMEEADGQSIDLDRLMETDSGEDKIFAAMGVAKTITTVSILDASFILPLLTFNRSSHRSNLPPRFSLKSRRL